jgi:hypothetical protein
MGTFRESGPGIGMGTLPTIAAFADRAPSITIVAQIATRRTFFIIQFPPSEDYLSIGLLWRRYYVI